MSELISVVYDYSEVLKWAEELNVTTEKWFPMALRNAVREAALFLEREAKIAAPVDTGRLRASIGHGHEGIWSEGEARGKGYWVDVGTNVEYAPYMEYGFTMSQGHVAYIKAAGGFRYVYPFTFEGYHFMKRAAHVTEQMIGKTLERHVRRALEHGGA